MDPCQHHARGPATDAGSRGIYLQASCRFSHFVGLGAAAPLPAHAGRAGLTRMLRLVARATVRGQGKTEGHHERSVVIGHGLKTVLHQPGMADELGEIARSRIEQVGQVHRILGHAIEVLAARGDEERISPENRHLARPWLKRLDELVDTRFFECLQDEFEAGESQRQSFRKRWLMNDSDGVIDHARALLQGAADTLPTPVMLRYRARVSAEALFERRLRGTNGLLFLFPEVGREVNNDN